MGIALCFVGIFFFSGQSDVRSGTSMPPCCVVNAITLYTLIHWIISNTAHAQSVDYLRVRRCMYGHAILITQIPWVYVSVHRATRRSVLEVPQHMSDYQNRKLSKNFPTKNTSWYLLMRERDKRLTWPKRIWRFHSESVRGSLMRERFVRWDCTQ